MAQVLIDTSVLIGMTRKQQAARDATERVAGMEPVLCDVVIGEILVGARSRKEYDDLYKYLTKTYRVLPFTVEVSERFNALVMSGERLTHGHLSDYLIAAIALAHDAHLLTLNRRDFGRLGGLKLL